MKTYKIPISWESYQWFTVEAENLEEAMSKALEEFMYIPDEQYLSGSVSFDEEGIQENYPDENYDLVSIYNNVL